MDHAGEEEIENIIRQYFTDEEWETMPEIIRTRHKNLYYQYTTVPNAEAFLPMPDFMKRSKELVNYNAGILNPSLRKVKEKEEKKRDREFKLPKSLLGSEPKKVRTNPKRSTTSGVNYLEQEVPNDDRYIYCDNCNQEYVDFCYNCGMLITVKDTLVPRGTPNRATKTAPRGVIEIKPSSIHGLGAFSLRGLPKGIQFGPYEGELCRVENTNGYSWKLKRGKLVDASDETISNWLRFVNCAAHNTQQNLVAFQYEGRLYYRTCREIKKGDELLVFYGESFAKILGIDKQKYFEPGHENVRKDVYCCKYCGLGLSTQYYRDRHEKYCKFRREESYEKEHTESFQCKHCTCLLAFEDDRNKHEKFCRRRKDLKESKRNDVQQNSKMYICDTCEYRTNRSKYLKKHLLLVHNKENAQVYSCSICNYKTVYQSSLSVHRRTHNKVQTFKCQFCTKNFKTKNCLDSHLLNNHYNEIRDRPDILTNTVLRCNFCSYQTIHSSHLATHIAARHRDSNTQTFICDKCQFKTYHKRNLIRHLLIHSDVKPVLCTSPLCNKGFNRKCYLDSHILNNHKDDEDLMKMITNKINKCPDCSYRSISIYNMKQHVQACHT